MGCVKIKKIKGKKIESNNLPMLSGTKNALNVSAKNEAYKYYKKKVTKQLR